jgi:uncharacterized protein
MNMTILYKSLIARFCLLITILLLIGGFAQAQTPQPTDTLLYHKKLFLIANNYADSVVLRWAPSNALAWRDYNNGGYLLFRYELTEDRFPSQPQIKALNSQPIKPWTLDEWKSRSLPEDSLSAVAAQLLYGRSNIPEATATGRNQGTEIDLNKAMDQKDDQDNRFSLALLIADFSPHVANGLGLRWVDKEVEKNKSYVYRIISLSNEGLTIPDTTATIVKTNLDFARPDMPEILYEEHDRAVIFRWNRRLADQFYSSYMYERSVDGGKTFSPVKNLPYVQPAYDQNFDNEDEIILKDSLPENYILYYYRIAGITPFGDKGNYSPAMPVMGRDLTPPEAPEQVSAEHIEGTKVLIKWLKPHHETDFAGFLVGRAESLEGPYEPLGNRLLPKTTTQFIDESAISWGTNFYMVSAVDTAGNAGLSVPAYVIMTDTIPPAKPQGLSGKIDTTGIVTLQWKLGFEPDLLGYLIYSANAPDHDFSPVSENFVVDSLFTDSISLNTLTKNIYYKIIAFDKNRNPSEASDILELKKPDFIAPVPPVITDFAVSDTTVWIHWNLSSSADVIKQIIFRKEHSSDWQELAQLDSLTVTYLDTIVERLTTYEYALRVMDEDGNLSEMSFPVTARVYDSGIRQAIINLNAIPDENEMAVNLSWSYEESEGVHFVIYRSVNASGFEMYDQSAGLKLIDRNLDKGVYEYAVKAFHKDGGQSPLTAPVRVEIR